MLYELFSYIYVYLYLLLHMYVSYLFMFQLCPFICVRVKYTQKLSLHTTNLKYTLSLQTRIHSLNTHSLPNTSLNKCLCLDVYINICKYVYCLYRHMYFTASNTTTCSISCCFYVVNFYRFFSFVVIRIYLGLYFFIYLNIVYFKRYQFITIYV